MNTTQKTNRAADNPASATMHPHKGRDSAPAGSVGRPFFGPSDSRSATASPSAASVEMRTVEPFPRRLKRMRGREGALSGSGLETVRPRTSRAGTQAADADAAAGAEIAAVSCVNCRRPRAASERDHLVTHAFATLTGKCRPIVLALLTAFSGFLVLGHAPAAADWTSDQPDRTSYVLFSQGGRDTTMSGSTDDLRRARRLRRGEEALLYVRQDGAAYVIRDAATLRRAEALFEPQRAMGARQAELGSRQAALGGRQAELGAEQENGRA